MVYKVKKLQNILQKESLIIQLPFQKNKLA